MLISDKVDIKPDEVTGLYTLIFQDIKNKR